MEARDVLALHTPLRLWESATLAEHELVREAVSLFELIARSFEDEEDDDDDDSRLIPLLTAAVWDVLFGLVFADVDDDEDVEM